MALFVINDISASKFSINGREMFKTFTPVYLNESTISVSNIYDSTQFLFRNVNVSDVEVDSVVYANATDLVTNLVPVIFVPQGEGSFSQAQIDQNTADILSLQTGKANINHNHDSLYYLKTEIDSIIANLPTGESIASGQVVFSDLIFYNATNVELFRIDCTRFLEQGTNLTFSNGLLSLKNDYNVELSNVNLNIQTLAYDDFVYAEGVALDFSNLLYANDFILVKNTSEETFFLSKINLSDSRLIFDFANFVTDLTSPVDTYLDWFVYEVDLSSLTFAFIESVLYRFDFRLKFAESTINKGIANGYAPLNSSTKIDSTYLPSYVDDVEEYANLGAFPVTGETGKIYIALDTNKTYRWTGSVYVEISQGVTSHSQLTLDDGTNPHGTTKGDVGLGNVDDTSDLNKPISTATQTALNGKENTITATSLITDFWSGNKTFRDLATDVRDVLLTGLSTATNSVITATDSILTAFGKLQAQTSRKWDLGGNAGTNPATDFIGTTDNTNFSIKVNGTTTLATFRPTGQSEIGNHSFASGVFALNSIGTGDRNSALDFISQSNNGLSARIIRSSGIDGSLSINQNGGSISFQTNSTSRIQILTDGRVGIATVSPQSGFVLDVNGAMVIRASSNITGSFIETGGNYRLSTGGTNAWVQVNGNFGVGINTPTDKLHVQGTARITGAIKDSSNSAGTSEQILSSTVTGTAWVNIKTVNGESLLGSGNIVNSVAINITDTDPLTPTLGQQWIKEYNTIDGEILGLGMLFTYNESVTLEATYNAKGTNQILTINI